MRRIYFSSSWAFITAVTGYPASDRVAPWANLSSFFMNLMFIFVDAVLRHSSIYWPEIEGQATPSRSLKSEYWSFDSCGSGLGLNALTGSLYVSLEDLSRSGPSAEELFPCQWHELQFPRAKSVVLRMATSGERLIYLNDSENCVKHKLNLQRPTSDEAFSQLKVRIIASLA